MKQPRVAELIASLLKAQQLAEQHAETLDKVKRKLADTLAMIGRPYLATAQIEEEEEPAS